MNISGDGKKSILGFEDYNTIWQLIYFSFQNPDSPYWICRPAAKSNQKKREVEWSFGIFLVFILNFEDKSWFQWWNKTKKKRLSFSNQNFIVKFFFLHIYRVRSSEWRIIIGPQKIRAFLGRQTWEKNVASKVHCPEEV